MPGNDWIVGGNR
ncbi:transcriptional regulator, partial [Mycobacterium tuberculosis UT0028]